MRQPQKMRHAQLSGTRTQFKVLRDPQLNGTHEYKNNVKAIHGEKIIEQDVLGLLRRAGVRDDFQFSMQQRGMRPQEHWLVFEQYTPEQIYHKPNILIHICLLHVPWK